MNLTFHILGHDVRIRRRKRYTWDYFRERLNAGTAVVCFSRCLYCGHPTPHEVCHQHSERTNPGWFDGVTDIDLLWGSRDADPPESCVDPDCPAWEPEEAADLRARQERETVLL